jgi:hypothetical protein
MERRAEESTVSGKQERVDLGRTGQEQKAVWHGER